MAINSRIVYIIAAIVLIAGAALLISNYKKSPNQGKSQDQQAGQPAAAGNQQASDAACTDYQNKTAVLDTSMGEIQIKLYDQDAPKTVKNFVCLIDRGYYDGIKFHRVAHGFVIQAGDPTGTGSGGDSIYGGPFADELNPDTASYKQGYIKGVVAMANSGPNTNTSQFFILTADHPELPHNYTIFGIVTSGMDVVEKIGSVAVTPGPFGTDDGAPVTPIYITKATIKSN